MKVNTKRSSLIASILLSLVLAVCAVASQLCLAGVNTTRAENGASFDRGYYYDELKNSDLAIRFYDVMLEMANGEKFFDGTYEYDLVSSGKLSDSELSEYLDASSPKIPVAFGAARDAFYMDHPDLFYVDVYKLYLSAGTQNSKNVAFIGTGKADNYYLDNAFSTAAQVKTAIEEYENKLGTLVTEAKKRTDPVEQIKFVNSELVKTVEYDYGAYENSISGNVYAAYVNTAYGALVKGKAMCGGYARAFKAVMDRLGIKCVLIQGSAYSGNSVAGLEAGFEAHMWNAVEIGGLWYGVDVTYNDGAVNKEKYMLVGDDFLSQNHFEDGVISSSGFELKYPALRPLDYGVNEDSSGFIFEDEKKVGDTQFGYDSFIDPDDGIEKANLLLGVSYEGKNGLELMNEGKYLVYRTSADGKEWSLWLCMPQFYKENYEEGEGYEGEYTLFNLNGTVNHTQYAIIDYAPDGFMYTYNADNLTDNHIIAVSTIYTNKGYGQYLPAPYVKKMTPDGRGMIKSIDKVHVTMEYNDELVYADEALGKDGVTVSVTATRNDFQKYIKIENLSWTPETSTLEFDFTPSGQYSHNCMTYNFVPTNLIGKTSKKVPEAGTLTFKLKQVVCPKVFNDGRLYMQVFGEPSFVSTGNLANEDFKDKNGQPIVGNQRSQLMLVVNHPSEQESDEMKDKLVSDTSLTQNDIKASSTYQIDLHVCGVVQRVPKGSYMQVGFGFPEGYGPENAGVSFTVYHYTRKADGTIDTVEEVPCVVTEYGIIATVKSFSPFMVCAVDSSKVQRGRNIYSAVSGEGGAIDKNTVTTLSAAGASVEYTFTPDSGYRIDRVLLDGKDVTAKVSANKMTVSYADVAANGSVLEVSFISERVYKYNADNGITIVTPQIVVKDSDKITAYFPGQIDTNPVEPKSHVALIVSLVVIGVLLIAGAGVALYFIFLKKQPETAGAAANKNATTKTTTRKTTKNTTTKNNTTKKRK